MVTASYGHYAARIGLDRTYWFHIPASFSVPFFLRKHGLYHAKLTRILPRWPGQGLAKLIWSGSKLVCRNHQARFLAGCNRPHYQSPTFRLGSVHPQTSWIISYKTSLDPIWLTVSGFGQTDLVRKQAGVQESSGLLLVNASQLIQSRCKSDPARLMGMHAHTHGKVYYVHHVLTYYNRIKKQMNNVYGLKGQATNLRPRLCKAGLSLLF